MIIVCVLYKNVLAFRSPETEVFIGKKIQCLHAAFKHFGKIQNVKCQMVSPDEGTGWSLDHLLTFSTHLKCVRISFGG